MSYAPVSLYIFLLPCFLLLPYLSPAASSLFWSLFFFCLTRTFCLLLPCLMYKSCLIKLSLYLFFSCYQGQIITLEIEDFDMEPGKDYVLIRDGEEPTDRQLAVLTGKYFTTFHLIWPVLLLFYGLQVS